MLSRLLIDLTCLSVPETGTRGIGRYAADLARAVASRARGNGLTVLGAERLDRDRPDGITTDVDGAIARLQSPDRAVKHQAWARLVRCGLAAAAKRNGADLVHSPDPNATPVGQIACPRVVTCHDLIGLAYPQEYLTWRDGWSAGRRMIERRRYTRADHIIAVSEGTARDLVRVLGIAERRITVVRNGIDLTRFSPSVTPDDAAVRERHGLAGLPYLLYVGAVEWRKNVDGMIAAIEMLRRRGIEQPALAWAGRLDGRELDIIRRLTAERGPHVDIRLLGWVPDAELSPLMRGAIALLFVSRMEGFGYPMIEAMASGCPVVASDRPFTVELAGDAAVRVDPERADEIADAAAALLANPAERRRLAERGLVRAQAFDVWRMADETLDVYRHVVATSTTGRM